MLDNIDDIRAYYAEYDEEGRLRRNQLEHEMTLKYLRRHLPERGRILELGAGTGHYTSALAQAGHFVHAVELSDKLLATARVRVKDAGVPASQVEFEVGDARYVQSVQEAGFDAVLIMGPLYHLIEARDREQVLCLSRRALRPGGTLVSTHINRLGIFGYMMMKYPEWIRDRRNIEFLLAHGYDESHPRAGGFRGYFSTPDRIVAEHEATGFRTEAIGSLEPAIGPADECFNRLEGELRREWVERLFELSAEASWLGAARHLIYVGKKPV